MSEEPVPYFALPSTALKSLFDEIRVSAPPEVAEEIIERYGMRCGEGLINNLGLESKDLEEFGNVIHALWSHVGLGRPVVTKTSKSEVVVEFKESLEAQAKGKSEQTPCTFSQGYLLGLVNQATGASHSVTEEKCMAKGDDVCRHVIRPLEKKAEVPPEVLPELQPVSDELRYTLERGCVYLVIDESAKVGYDIFKDLVEHENAGFCVTRTFPMKIRNEYKIKTPILWLTKETGEGTLIPHNLAKLNFIMEEHIKKEANTALMLDGLEYLITHNSYEPILRFLQILNDKVAIHNSVLIIPVNPYTLDQKHLKLLEREMKVYRPEMKNAAASNVK